MKYVLLLALLIAQPTFARSSDGDEKGNGGDVVVCRNASDRITPVEMLDYYEARVLWGIQVELPAGISPEEIALRALAPLRKFSPIRTAMFEETVKGFSSETKFLPGVELVDIPDSDHIAIPRGCRIEQLVVQQKKRFPEDARFVVNLDLWSVMDDRQRAGAILHEAFYTEALGSLHRSSRNARYFHAKMVSVEASRFSDRDFMQITTSANFGFWEIREIFKSHEQGPPLLGPDLTPDARRYFQPGELRFSDRGDLLEFSHDRGVCDSPFLRLSHSLIHVEPEYPTYSRCVRRVEFRQGPNGRTVVYHRPENTMGVIRLNGQITYVTSGTIQSHPDGSLELEIRAGRQGGCYVNPRDGQAVCGRITIGRDGNVRDQRLTDLEIEGWKFTDPSGSTRVQRTAEGLHFYSIGKEARATFTWHEFSLEFADLEELFITLAGRPSSKKKQFLAIAGGMISGNVVAPEMVLLNPGVGVEEGAAFSSFIFLGEKEPRTFFVKSNLPLNLSAGGVSFRSNSYELLTNGESVAVPLNGASFSLQGKRMQTDAGDRIRIASHGLSLFRLSRQMRPVQFTMSDRTTKKTGRAGDYVRLGFGTMGKTIECVGPDCE